MPVDTCNHLSTDIWRSTKLYDYILVVEPLRKTELTKVVYNAGKPNNIKSFRGQLLPEAREAFWTDAENVQNADG